MKKVRVGFFIILSIFVLSCISYADTSILKVSYKKSGAPGSLATLNVSLQNTDTFDSAITSIEGYLNFDNNVFNDMTVDSIETANGKVQIGTKNSLDVIDLSGFSISNSLSSISGDAGLYFNSNPISGHDNKIVIDFSNPIAEDAKLFTINLSVKSDATPQEYQNAIEITGFKAYFEDNTTRTIDTARLSFTVIQGSSSDTADTANNSSTNNTVNNIVNNTTINNIVNNSTVDNDVNDTTINNTVDENSVNNIVDNNTIDENDNDISNRVVNNNTNKAANSNAINNNDTNSLNGKTEDPTTANKSLPYTGVKTILIPAFILAIISYVIYKKYNEEKID